MVVSGSDKRWTTWLETVKWLVPVHDGARGYVVMDIDISGLFDLALVSL